MKILAFKDNCINFSTYYKIIFLIMSYYFTILNNFFLYNIIILLFNIILL